ncbi:glycosyltransferase family 4 protein [Shivajiella indica]|uniref:Glycosyltransferase family 4 protein n=1 Tax=Shivajiella indica TaxID=872115 RepID=A0ABW5BEP6_9BACT
MQNKRVLIITYYWPPSGGSGVQRWLKFAKYLPEFGWEPVIFTPENPDFELKDESLLKEINPLLEVLKFPIWEPYGLFRKLKKQKSGDTSKVLEKKKKGWLDKLGIWLRANVFIPDPRVFWVKPSVNFLTDLVQKGQFHAIITTGPPHSMHLIGLQLHEKTGIPWLADFRDPWSKWEFLDTLPMTSIVRRKHDKLEQKVLFQASAITTISPSFKMDFEKMIDKKTELLTNGFDTEDLPLNWIERLPSKDGIEILYTGVVDAIRNPDPFLIAFKKAFETSGKKVKVRFVGKVSETLEKMVAQDIWLRNHVVMEGYVSHEKVFDFYAKAHLLLLVLTDTKNAKGNIPGKLFEYIATGRPVVALGDPKGDAAKILQTAGAGQVFSHKDIKGIQNFLENFIPQAEFQVSREIQKYSRKNLTGQLAGILERISIK